MSDSRWYIENDQQYMAEISSTKDTLNQLLFDSKLYKRSKDYKNLLDFVARLRNFAPFNAMLLQIQKPGLRFAASARDWQERFGRWPKEGARPLIILQTFGPVALVYDEMDTEGKPLPEDVSTFFASGDISESKIVNFKAKLNNKNIKWYDIDEGDQRAGSIRIIEKKNDEKQTIIYQVNINKNHSPSTKFATLVHELGHLFLGHLGPNKNLKIPKRPQKNHRQLELEAESVSYIVCKRNKIKSKSHTYLNKYVKDNTTIDVIDIHQVINSVKKIEDLLGLEYNINKSLCNGNIIKQTTLF